MITLRLAGDRGHANFGWLDSNHSFSFGNYHDPAHMGFSHLRVINEDRVAPGGGFATHGHRDMEIISYVIDGALEHKDSLGTGSVIRPGDVQRMSAGTGIRHSEYNASDENAVHFLQIWILPEQQNIEPGYEQTFFSDADKQGQLRLVASRDGRDGSVTVHQDVSIYAARLDPGETVEYDIAPERSLWLQVVRGNVLFAGEALQAGDGAAVSDEQAIAIAGQSDHSEILLFDLASLALAA